jgi:hypothetical protein
MTINGRLWRVIWRPMRSAWGTYDDKVNIIEMDSSIRDNLTAATILIHEALHAMWPDVDEANITQRADELAVALHRAKLIAEDDHD